MNKEKDRGLSGLANLGNTCFMNATLQILSHCYELNEFLDKGNSDYRKRLKKNFDSLLLLEWDNLRQQLWKENAVVSPMKFVKTVQKLAQIKKMDLFTGFSQNDSTEFLLFVIDCFHNSLSREVTMTITGTPFNEKDKIAIQCYEMVQKMYSKDYSEIWNLFYGINLSQIVSLDNELLSMKAEPFMNINLSIPDNNKTPSLVDCFRHYVEGELLEGENAWYNETKKEKQNVKKKIIFWSFPSILVVDLKRFNKYNFHNKNQILVDFPLENLDLSEFVVGYKKESYVYDLFGISNHYGGTKGGHYTAFVKTENDKWYHFNDTSVQPVQDVSKIITPHAYCFFYRKKTV
jgi:ubiquitin carboxyl-terminal hydrolase 8